jgi:hypothetical protein
MVKIYQGEYTRKLSRDLRIAQAVNNVPDDLASEIQPVFVINYPFNIRNASTTTSSTSSTLMTTRTDAETYVISASLAVIKDASATSVDTRLNVTSIEGALLPILRIPGISLTAQSETISINFPIPIRLGRGTAVTLTNSTAVANIVADCSFQYFEVPD